MSIISKFIGYLEFNIKEHVEKIFSPTNKKVVQVRKSWGRG